MIEATCQQAIFLGALQMAVVPRLSTIYHSETTETSTRRSSILCAEKRDVRSQTCFFCPCMHDTFFKKRSSDI